MVIRRCLSAALARPSDAVKPPNYRAPFVRERLTLLTLTALTQRQPSPIGFRRPESRSGLRARSSRDAPFICLFQESPFLGRTECRRLSTQRSDGSISAHVFQDR